MLNKFPLWKNLLLVAVVIIGLIYAAPILFGDDPSVQITGNSSSAKIDAAIQAKIIQELKTANILYKSIEISEDNHSELVRFYDADAQFRASGVLKSAVPDAENYTIALNLAPATPRWLTALGASSMKLGLDLRGGVHFLLSIDLQSAVYHRLDGIIRSVGDQLRNNSVRYLTIDRDNDKIIAKFRDQENMDKAYPVITKYFPKLTLSKEQNGFSIIGKLQPAAVTEIRDYTIEQTMTTLRNRVNLLGISEAIVQQQGSDRIVVDLPGIQDSARAKQILGGNATLEFYIVDTEHDLNNVMMSGLTPPGTRIYKMDDRPILLKMPLVLSGDSITSSTASFDDKGRPNVEISLGGGGETLFNRVTRANIGNHMAIVYIETKALDSIVDGIPVKIHKRIEKVISAPTIQSALGNNFQITGLTDPTEAKNLSLMLRAGAMPTSYDIIEERVIGPSLGAENIRLGALSVAAAFIIIVIFMGLYYRMFGLFADAALALNLVLVVAVLSILGATLTLAGIAGIVLNVGMAVDANVLIFERIREELRHGMSPQASIYAGFERAFNTILDANVTVLIVAMVLFGIGSGPIKGFAVTLTIGTLASMFTAVTFTRGLVNWYYGGRHQVKKLSIGLSDASYNSEVKTSNSAVTTTPT
ncbi:protein translocase subunit SecD [soil metagenome]